MAKLRGRRDFPCRDDGEAKLTISVTEAAKMLGISRNFAYELVREHKLPIIKLGKRLLIPRVALVKMLEQGGTYEGTH